MKNWLMIAAGVLLLFMGLFFETACSKKKPPAPYGPVPTEAQLAWHEMEMYGLIHYGVDTYTDKEWGYGDESPALVNPARFSAEQIVSAAKAGGLKGVIVVSGFSAENDQLPSV